jgi:hypothetical protein
LALTAMVVMLSSCKKAPVEEEVDTDTSIETPADVEVEAAMIPIPIKLPAAIVEGTPSNLKGIENLEKYVKVDLSKFLVPAGTANVALNKPVTGSDEDPIGGTIDQVVDGDMSGADGSWLEFGLFEQYIVIDLGAKHEIYAVMMWHYFKQARVYNDVVVQTSDDPDFITNVVTLFNNDIDNTHGLGSGTDKNYVEMYDGKLIDAKGVVGRYIRCYSNGSNSSELNNYVEVAVFGKPVK